MEQTSIEGLLKAANSSPDGDTSVNQAKRIFLDESEAAAFFEQACSELLRIDRWRENSSATTYDIFDDAGKEAADQTIAVGRFIRIHLYGGGKYDWVRVVSIVDEPEEFIVKVKPSYDPTGEPVDTSVTSHFFGPEAENNFCVQLHESSVTMYVIGLNEHQNTKFTDGLIESARNVALSNIGYYTGLQKAVWKEFCGNFMKAEDEKAAA